LAGTVSCPNLVIRGPIQLGNSPRPQLTATLLYIPTTHPHHTAAPADVIVDLGDDTEDSEYKDFGDKLDVQYTTAGSKKLGGK